MQVAEWEELRAETVERLARNGMDWLSPLDIDDLIPRLARPVGDRDRSLSEADFKRDTSYLELLELTSWQGWYLDNVATSLPKLKGLEIPEDLDRKKSSRQAGWGLFRANCDKFFARKKRYPKAPVSLPSSSSAFFMPSDIERDTFTFAFALNKVYGNGDDEEGEVARAVFPPEHLCLPQNRATNMAIPISGRRPIVRDEDMPRDDVKGCWFSMKLTIMHTTALFTCRTTLTEELFDKTMRSVKLVLNKSQQEHETRFWLGTAIDLWEDLTECWELALVALKAQADYQVPQDFSCWADFVLSHSSTLLKDLERLNDFLLLARNMLASTTVAQNYAAEAKFDKQVLLMLELCIQVTERGYDGDPGHRNEALFAPIANSFKVLLVTCLQFLHNLIMQNENRKLHLWLDLFCIPADVPLTIPKSEVPSGANEDWFTETKVNDTMPREEDITRGINALFGPFESVEQQEEKELTEKARFSRLLKLFASGLGFDKPEISDTPESTNENTNEDPSPSDVNKLPTTTKQDPSKYFKVDPDMGVYDMANIRDHGVGDHPRSIESLAPLYLNAKKDLVRPLGLNFQEVAPLADDGIEELEDEDDEPEEEEDEEEDEEDEEYSEEEEHGEDGVDFSSSFRKPRGILTDIPLVLGPSEIEALPLILQACIFSAKDPAKLTKPQRLMQALRCNLLLHQEAGMALLRELLIFIAAWDLQEDELYFKIMANIISAIMSYNLLPFAYKSFEEDKEPVSPAQSILLKLVLYNFRRKLNAGPPSIPSPTHNLANLPEGMKPDTDIIMFLLGVFRETVMPTTLALIWLQGQVSEGTTVTASNFTGTLNINLWDMERLYEGVYIFLDFFSAVNDMQLWKSLLVGNSLEYDILVLLRALDEHIPKLPFITASPTAGSRRAASTKPTTEDHASSSTMAAAPVAVERPYSPTPEVPLTSPMSPPVSPSHSDPDASQAPHAFPWRNLKKMCILVLSGLLFRTPQLRASIRAHGGIELILGCCNYDGYNPYIKEHALLCLKFLMEGDAENQRMVRELEARELAEDGAERLAELGLEARVEGGRVQVGRTAEAEGVEHFG